MKETLHRLNRTPGILGSAWIGPCSEVVDMGEAVGGGEGAGLARQAAAAYRAWLDARPEPPTESAVFVGERGRIVAQAAGDGILVAFAENDAHAGLLRLRVREAAERNKDPMEAQTC